MSSDFDRFIGDARHGRRTRGPQLFCPGHPPQPKDQQDHPKKARRHKRNERQPVEDKVSQSSGTLHGWGDPERR